MRLNKFGREVYSVTITTDPVATGVWEASFDGGSTWSVGEDQGNNSWGWLIAGPENTGGTPVFSITQGQTDIIPLLRLTVGDEQIVERGPEIAVV